MRRLRGHFALWRVRAASAMLRRMDLGAWGLTFDQSKGKWKFRPTIHRGRKKVGKRITVALSGAVSERDAMAARDAALGALRAVGLTIHQRHQRRAGASGDGMLAS